MSEAVLSAPVKGRSLWDDAGRRLMRNKAAVAGMVLLGVLVLLAVVGPYLVPFAYDQVDKDDVWLPPLQAGHLLGSDALGRDLTARLLTVYGVWQRQGEVRHLVAKRLVDHSALLRELDAEAPDLKAPSRDFR